MLAEMVDISMMIRQWDPSESATGMYCWTRVDRWQDWYYGSNMATATKAQENLRAAMREALRIQDRFVAEPLFAKTGQGFLKSEGVATLQQIKANLRRKKQK